MNNDNGTTDINNAGGGEYMGFASAEEMRKAIAAEEKYLKRRYLKRAIFRNIPVVLCFFAGVGISILVQHLQ